MYIIPAIDVLDKKVVRLREGNYDDVTTYPISLEEQIEKYHANGTEIVHIIDLNGAKGDFSNQAYLFDIIRRTEMKVQYGDRKSTRLNSSHVKISYAVFCLKKKKKRTETAY